MAPRGGKRKRVCDEDSDETFIPSNSYHRTSSATPARRSSRLGALPTRRRIIDSESDDSSGDAPCISRYDYPVVIPEWSEDGSVIMPASPFAELPDEAGQAQALQAIRSRFRKKSMSMVSCVFCFRNSPRYTTSTMEWLEFIHDYGEFLQFPESMRQNLPAVPTFVSRVHREAYDLLAVNWAGVRQSGRKIKVNICPVCSLDKGVRKAPRYAAVHGTWVGDTPECLQGLTLAEEILIGMVFMRGLVVFLDGQGPMSHRQRGFKGHVISFPLHAGSTLQALTDLPRTSDELSETIAVVYNRKANGRADIRQRYAGTLDKLVYVRRARVRDALVWLKANNPLYKDINVVAANLDTLPENDVPDTVWNVSFKCIGEAELVGLDRRTEVLYSYVRDQRAEAPSAQRGTEVYVPGTRAAQADLATRSQPQVSVEDPERSRYDGIGDLSDDDGQVDYGIVSTGLCDLNATGVAARQVKRTIMHRLVYMRPGVGSSPVSEFDDGGELLAKAFPVLFPYGVGAPGVLAAEGYGQRIKLHDHAELLIQHVNSRFEEHRLFTFALLNMIQRHAACRAAKAILRHRDMPSLEAAMHEMTDDHLRIMEVNLKGGMGLDQAMALAPEPFRRILSKVNIVGHAVPGSPHARRKLLPQLQSMMTTLGPPTLYITINPVDFASPILMHWITGKGDLDTREPMKDIPLERMKLVAEHPALAARYFHEMCLAFQDIILGQTSGGIGIFGKTSGYFGVSETQGRGTLHCHYVVWLEGAGTSDGVQRAVELDGEGVFKRKLVAFYDAIAASCFDIPMEEVADARPKAAYCMPPNLAVPVDAESTQAFATELRADAEWVARESNMHKATHTFTCWKGGRSACRFGFPKECFECTTYSTEDGLVGRRNDPYLNTFNPVIACALRCNHDIKYVLAIPARYVTLLAHN